jgi:hypothetical protein
VKILVLLRDMLVGWLDGASPAILLRDAPECISRIEFELLPLNEPGEYSPTASKCHFLQYSCTVYDLEGHCIYSRISDLGKVVHGYYDQAEVAETITVAHQEVMRLAEYWRKVAPEHIVVTTQGKEIPR